MFEDLNAELWISRRLNDSTIFAGITTPELRAERVRAILLERGLADEIAGRRGGEEKCWREIFQLVYGFPLTQETSDDEAILSSE